MRIERVAPVKPINPDARRVRVLYNGKQTVVGVNGSHGVWLYVLDKTRTYA